MKINYNDWFYNQHKYLKGNREGVESFNDTKWVDMNKRYLSILNLGSNLINEQPFGVVGNNKGFDKLIDLLSKSNYTFEDINESLIETYKLSLRNAMSRMIVNNHSVMFRCNNMDRKHVSSDKYTGYFIIDVPFNQLHFGDRDEFIRQKLHKMHNTENDYYIPINEFVTSEISNILGFSMLCTVNGFICNDCKIGVDDKGFKFKIKWGYSSDVEFIIYKFDEALVHKCDVKSSYIIQNKIPYNELKLKENMSSYGYKCLVNIYDKNFESTVPSVPNFGYFDNEGFVISNIQNRTIKNIEEYKTSESTVVIYVLKYFHEIPNVYPAVNYYDIIDCRKVFTENSETVRNVKNDRIVSSQTDNTNDLEICTPPITLDRQINMSFNTISSCLGLYDDLMKFSDIFESIGRSLSNDITYTQFVDTVIRPLNDIYDEIHDCYIKYIQGAILTSLVPSDNINRFNKIITYLDKLRNLTDINKVQLYTIDEFYGNNYKLFVENITIPFRDSKLSNFTDINELSKNYFTESESNYDRFNRPISEQCFITLRYHRDEECWLFDLPNIKHFKGIGNTFYIDDNLDGDELFKFFVLYTDTGSVAENKVPELPLESVLDFDLFCKEVDKHIGYIRYWYAENKLMKLSKILYNKYDGDMCVQVLSKILKRKLSGEDILDIYPSEINYEPSNITSDNIDGWDDNSDRAPFAINFLFYTLSMLNGNEDKLETYFLHRLTSDKFNNRYSDIDISSILNEEKTYPVNFSKISVLSEPFSWGPLDREINIFYGLPFMVNSDGSETINPYLCTFNVYNTETEHSSIFDEKEYIKYSEHVNVVSYRNDINVCKLMTYYLNYIYDYIGELQTNYTKTFNQISLIDSAIETIENHINEVKKLELNHSFLHRDTLYILRSVIYDNEFLIYMNKIKNLINNINTCVYNGRNISVVEFFNKVISTLKDIYVTTGFDNYALKKTRMLYINLKKINTPMNPYQYRKWLINFDEDTLKSLNKVLADNENFNLNPSILDGYYNTFINYRDNIISTIDELISTVKELSINLKTEHIDPIVEYCDYIINNYIKDLFIISEIEFDKSLSLDSKPGVILIKLYDDDNHIYNPSLEDVSLIFYPNYHVNDNKYHITSISKICEYAFFNGETIENCYMTILDDKGSEIYQTDADIHFMKIGSTGDISDTFNQISNINNTTIDIQNVHESFDVDESGLIINKKHANMNYEMLIGNHFSQLDHTSQKILQPKTLIQGSVDRIFIPNKLINDLVNDEYSKHVSPEVFFKPTQVIHIPMTNDIINSIGGKYFVGQRLYVITDDESYIFPIIITAIDHSANSGFIEAEVDKKNCKWFNIQNKALITKYLTENIDCHVINDNMRNFLNEFNNPNYKSFYSATQYDKSFSDIYSLPGDPIFVNSNSSLVHNRLNWFFNDIIPNRFIDDEHKKHRFIYIGDAFINSDNDPIKIKMVNHNFNEYTNPELYPILRDEPNDHVIWDKEIEVFNQQIYSSEMKMSDLNRAVGFITNELNLAKTESERQRILLKLEDAKRNIESEESYQTRLKSYAQQLESPTTWYNVRAYEDTLVYITNGRAKLSPSTISNIRDIPFDNTLDVFIYDWEHKRWLDPKSYNVEQNKVDAIRFYEYDDYKTNDVIHSITIHPNEGFVPSRKLLIYLSYYSSNIFSNIKMNDYTCKVRFKPILSLPGYFNDIKPYHDIKIRKHFDGYESYTFNEYNAPDNFSIKESFYIKRPERSGKYNYSPSLRFCDLNVSNGNRNFNYENFDMYIRIPFKDISTTRNLKIQKFKVEINQPMESFVEYVYLKMICIQNNESSLYDGNISNIMFEGYTSYDESGNPSIMITKSTLPKDVEGSFVCTVFKDDRYKTFGGLITINVTISERYLIDILNGWIKVPEDVSSYKEIPDEFIIVPKNLSSININDSIKITLKNLYKKETNEDIQSDNSSLYNPTEYYFDTINKTRLPISDIRNVNTFKNRLVVNRTLNPDIKLVKSTYLGVCRYSLQTIPENGFIDLTGYIPTPLSRDRYEFWVNGRQIMNTSDIIILSPTSIQLRNLKSLRNFELIELVENIDDSIFTEDIIYADINGSTHTSYIDALKSNRNIFNQDIRYSYNKELHKPIQDYSNGILSNPNNKNIEVDILDSLITDSSGDTDYNNSYNIPTINGCPIYHPTTTSLGIEDIPKDKILDMLNDVWKYEIMTNPLFSEHHGPSEDGYLKLYINQSDESFMIQTRGSYEKYFTLYISKIPNAKIDDTLNTIKIIPFIKIGTIILIDKQYKGMWLNSTVDDISILIK